MPPDPDLPQADPAALWAWVALLGGIALLMAVTFTTTLPLWLAWVGGAATLGGLVALLARVPRGRDEDDDGTRV